jgi:hypothetical protein
MLRALLNGPNGITMALFIALMRYVVESIAESE